MRWEILGAVVGDEHRGAGFLVRVLQAHVIGEPEGELVAEIACTLDLIDELQAALSKSSAVVDGRPNPIVVELRQQRTLLAKLLSQLPPAVEPGPTAPPSPRSEQAKRAAEARWSKHREIRGVTS